jgi:hypothetical protein
VELLERNTHCGENTLRCRTAVTEVEVLAKPELRRTSTSERACSYCVKCQAVASGCQGI